MKARLIRESIVERWQTFNEIKVEIEDGINRIMHHFNMKKTKIDYIEYDEYFGCGFVMEEGHVYFSITYWPEDGGVLVEVDPVSPSHVQEEFECNDVKEAIAVIIDYLEQEYDEEARCEECGEYHDYCTCF